MKTDLRHRRHRLNGRRRGPLRRAVDVQVIRRRRRPSIVLPILLSGVDLADNSWTIEHEITFNATWMICTPGDYLILYVAIPVDDYHGDTGVGEIWYTFVADNGDEFSPRMPCS